MSSSGTIDGVSGATSASSFAGKWPFLTALFLADITGAFETSMIYAAVKSIIAEFGDATAVGWMVTIYGLVGAGCAAICGRLGDMYGRRRVLLILLALGVAGSVLSAVTDNFYVLLIGRGMQGLGIAILPLLIGLLRQNLPADRVPIGVGLMVSAASAGTACGLILGGLIVDHMSWRHLFVASAVLGGLAMLAAWRFVPTNESTSARSRIDWVSCILFLPGIAFVLLALGKGSTWGWTAATTLGFGLGGLIMLTAWILWSLRTTDPLIDIRLLLRRRVAVANLVSVMVAFGALQITLVFAMLLQSPIWTGIGMGVTATVSGLIKLPSNILSVFAGPWSGWMSANWDDRIPVFVGGAMVATGWATLIFFHDSLWVIGGLICLISVGTTILYTAIPNLIVPAVPEDRTSEAMGTMAVIRSVAMAIGAQLVTWLLATSVVTKAGEAGSYPDTAAFTLTFIVVALLTVGGTLLVLAIPSSRKKAA